MWHRALLVGISVIAFAAAAFGQRPSGFENAEETRAALNAALAERRTAQARSERLETEAAQAEGAAERAARESAALAARIQQAEAGIAAARARMAMVTRERADLREALGREQRPLVRLTAALQQFSRRPLALSVLRQGEVRDIVYLRAVLHSAVPQVEANTADLRTRIARAAQLRETAGAAAEVLRAEEIALGARRAELAEIETRERLSARAAGSGANREAERALALAEQARDLGGLMGEIEHAAALRERLAALPGPRPRPAEPATAQVGENVADVPVAGTNRKRAPSPYILPVTGRTLAGFGAPVESGLNQGLTLGPLAGAQVVAPAAGRIAFAGPYRGFGQIVIIEHGGGWTSLVTGLARIQVRVGQEVLDGAPLGVAGPGRPSISVELRRDGEPVNPLPYVG